jgi:hypothetical protein
MRNDFNTKKRIALSLFVIVCAWAIGAIITGIVFPNAHLLNKIESLPEKIGSSIAVLIVSFLLAKFILKSFRQLFFCIIVVETFAFIVVLVTTQLWEFTWFDLKCNINWLFTITWNVVIAYAIGSAIGHRMIKKC